MINRTNKEYNDNYIVDLLDALNEYVGLNHIGVYFKNHGFEEWIMKRRNRFIALLIIAIIVALGVFAHIEGQKAAEEKERQESLINAAKSTLEEQYFPVDGEATAIYFSDYNSLRMVFLNGDMLENRAKGTVVYTYDLYYESDHKFRLVATLDQISSNKKEDYSFRCTLHTDEGAYVLSDLETENPYPEFDTSRMLTGQDKSDMEEREGQQISEEIRYFIIQNNLNQHSNENSSASESSSSSLSGSSSDLNQESSNSSDSYYDKTDPSDHDIEQYYYDYEDEFEDEGDAWDDFMDNEEYWDDY